MTGKEKKKTSIGILFGGRSCEHEVSVISARSVLEAIDHDRYNVTLIGIDKQGHWHLHNDMDALLDDRQVAALDTTTTATDKQELVSLALHHQGQLTPAGARNVTTGLPELDVLFPVLHGTFGEDGTIQGVFEMAGIPYVGCGVAASAIAMDKALAKQVFAAAGIPQAPCQVVHNWQWRQQSGQILDRLEREFGYPQFVKPANMGSSVGVNKASDRTGLEKAIVEALQYDRKVIVEQSMENCHEVECAILGNEHPEASVVGEILPGAEFYDYQTKYIDDKSKTLIPATIPEQSARKVQELAIRAFQAVDGAGLSRVDFFVSRETGEVYLNELNTLPGFTPISMYPKMWQASGIEYSELIDKLIDLALKRHQDRASLKRAL